MTTDGEADGYEVSAGALAGRGGEIHARTARWDELHELAPAELRLAERLREIAAAARANDRAQGAWACRPGWLLELEGVCSPDDRAGSVLIVAKLSGTRALVDAKRLESLRPHLRETVDLLMRHGGTRAVLAKRLGRTEAAIVHRLRDLFETFDVRSRRELVERLRPFFPESGA